MLLYTGIELTIYEILLYILEQILDLVGELRNEVNFIINSDFDKLTKFDDLKFLYDSCCKKNEPQKRATKVLNYVSPRKNKTNNSMSDTTFNSNYSEDIYYYKITKLIRIYKYLFLLHVSY